MNAQLETLLSQLPGYPRRPRLVDARETPVEESPLACLGWSAPGGWENHDQSGGDDWLVPDSPLTFVIRRAEPPKLGLLDRLRAAPRDEIAFEVD